MLLLIESLIGIALFTLIIIPMDIKDPLAVIGDYPPAIRRRCEELGLIEKRERQLSKKDLIKKGVAVILLVFIAAIVMIKVNHATIFLQGFGWTYIIWLAITWFDALAIDCGWFCHSKRMRIPGTEDMKEYHDYLFHIKASLIGTLIGLPACATVGLVVMLFA
ncbi:MAG: hypothetical protein K6A70_09765 [Erysipelotrichaceae bacterium]|nr:hypothetical protein [Erysipelotrichaceae bacterium]